MADLKQIVFVRGTKQPELTMWRYFHFHPHDEVDIGPVQLVYFDYPENQLLKWKRWKPVRGSKREDVLPDPDSVEDLEPRIEWRNYEDQKVQRTPKRASIVALYDYVKAQPSKSILSLQFFSHGFWKGPILWNDVSEDDAVAAMPVEEPRDPHDTEPRVRDFYGLNPLAGTDGFLFAGSFVDDPFVKLWGCDAADAARLAINTILDEDTSTREGRVRRLHDVGQYLEDRIGTTYALHLADLLGVTVWGAPPGWGSNPWSGPEKLDDDTYMGNFPPDLSKERWWRMTTTFKRRHERFFRDELEAPIDAARYIGFNVGWYHDAVRRNRAGKRVLEVTDPKALQKRLRERHPWLPGAGD